MVEPEGYPPETARLKKGWAGSPFSRSKSFRGTERPKMLESKLG